MGFGAAVSLEPSLNFLTIYAKEHHHDATHDHTGRTKVRSIAQQTTR